VCPEPTAHSRYRFVVPDHPYRAPQLPPKPPIDLNPWLEMACAAIAMAAAVLFAKLLVWLLSCPPR
jgi:hypothetical protein